MTPLSWLYMGIVWATIIGLNVFCFYRIFKKKKGTGQTEINNKEKEGN